MNRPALVYAAVFVGERVGNPDAGKSGCSFSVEAMSGKYPNIVLRHVGYTRRAPNVLRER